MSSLKVKDDVGVQGVALAYIPVLLAAITLATRLPFIGQGYGEDPDAWRAIIAGQHLLETGSYVPSRTPGYPLPEYINALMLAVGLGSSLWVCLLSALVCAAAAVLVYRLFEPLGSLRALIGALAFAFTPEVFVASVSALDHLWGLAFFVAATLMVARDRRWLAGLFLGLAVASRPTYALAAIPLMLFHVQFDARRLVQIATWRRLLPPLLFSAAIATAFFFPVILSMGRRMYSVYDVTPERWLKVAYHSSVGLFGVLGFCAIAAATMSALSRRKHKLIADNGHAMNGWAFNVIILWGLLFIRLPHEAAYLLPAVVAFYWLLCRYANVALLWLMVLALAASCFVLSIDGRTRSISPVGAAVWNTKVQNERTCITGVVREVLESSPTTYVVAAFIRPQLLVQLGEPLSQRVLYNVRPDDSGQLVDIEAAPFPQDGELVVLDVVAETQASVWPGPIRVLPTANHCP